eukprot:CAMPEP_0206256600 /NCGR_PEP_ID=MMETSP0047_2-20121206/24866_1 /ASSEMBLY_ACC=CAM_ASM_000192 /TAXON_ID=195065 /ORGANISM="Chroomonas mesostigmatica_cf, Strain CCMP1168" /LENGTH=63 /DNA_ID=CAMNT_0053683075 /DNA_START=90 /DNA_END=281 /DNA_ORIENTATION=+
MAPTTLSALPASAVAAEPDSESEVLAGQVSVLPPPAFALASLEPPMQMSQSDGAALPWYSPEN